MGGGVKITETKFIGPVEFENTQNEVKYIILVICFGVSGHEFLHVHAQLQYVNCRVSVPEPH